MAKSKTWLFKGSDRIERDRELAKRLKGKDLTAIRWRTWMETEAGGFSSRLVYCAEVWPNVVTGEKVEPEKQGVK